MGDCVQFKKSRYLNGSRFTVQTEHNDRGLETPPQGSETSGKDFMKQTWTSLPPKIQRNVPSTSVSVTQPLRLSPEITEIIFSARAPSTRRIFPTNGLSLKGGELQLMPIQSTARLLQIWTFCRRYYQQTHAPPLYGLCRHFIGFP